MTHGQETGRFPAPMRVYKKEGYEHGKIRSAVFRYGKTLGKVRQHVSGRRGEDSDPGSDRHGHWLSDRFCMRYPADHPDPAK